MKDKLKNMALGLSLTIFLLITSGIIIYLLVDIGLVVWQILITIILSFVIVISAVFLLGKDINRKVRCIIAGVLAFLLLSVQAFGGYYLIISRSALKKITEPESEFTEIGIYVRIDDTAQALSDTAGYSYGILKTQDRTATDLAIKEIGNISNIKEYDGVEQLLDALVNLKEVNAIILNKSFITLLDEVEGNIDYTTKIREIHSFSFKNESIKKSEKSEYKKVFTVCISGIDCYGSTSRKGRSDVNILATVNTETGQVLLVSTPRDYYVPLSISNGVPDKLTHAGIYGIDVTRDTLSMLYGIEIDYYFRVNFDGFQEIIDALGGISVISDYDFSSQSYNFTTGENVLDGKKALAFARNRYSFSGGDRQRGKNQMAVIKGVINKLADPSIISNYKEILDGLKGAFNTDISYENVTKIIQKYIKDGTKWNVVSYSVDGKGANENPYSLSSYVYVMKPDQLTVDRAKELIKQVKIGATVKP